MNMETFIEAYNDIVRNYLRDDAMFDKRFQKMYPQEYRQTMDTYGWIDEYLKTTVFPILLKNGGEIKGNGVEYEGRVYKEIDKMTRRDFDAVWNLYNAENGTKFWVNIPDLGNCAKELEESIENDLEEDYELD